MEPQSAVHNHSAVSWSHHQPSTAGPVAASSSSLCWNNTAIQPAAGSAEQQVQPTSSVYTARSAHCSGDATGSSFTPEPDWGSSRTKIDHGTLMLPAAPDHFLPSPRCWRVFTAAEMYQTAARLLRCDINRILSALTHDG